MFLFQDNFFFFFCKVPYRHHTNDKTNLNSSKLHPDCVFSVIYSKSMSMRYSCKSLFKNMHVKTCLCELPLIVPGKLRFSRMFDHFSDFFPMTRKLVNRFAGHWLPPQRRTCYLDDGFGFLFDARQRLLHAGDVRQLPQLRQRGGCRQLLGDLLALPFALTRKFPHGHAHDEALHVRGAVFFQHLGGRGGVKPSCTGRRRERKRLNGREARLTSKLTGKLRLSAISNTWLISDLLRFSSSGSPFICQEGGGVRDSSDSERTRGIMDLKFETSRYQQNRCLKKQITNK